MRWWCNMKKRREKDRRGDRDVPLTKEVAEKIVEGLKAQKTPYEIYTSLGVNYQSFRSWIVDALFGPIDKRTEEEKIIRDGILNSVFREIVLEKIFKVISEPQEKITIKETTLHTLSKAEEKSLENQGYLTFLEQFAEDGILLKVEKTVDTIPIPVALLERLIKLVESGTAVEELAEKLIAFNPPDPECPDV